MGKEQNHGGKEDGRKAGKADAGGAAAMVFRMLPTLRLALLDTLQCVAHKRLLNRQVCFISLQWEFPTIKLSYPVPSTLLQFPQGSQNPMASNAQAAIRCHPLDAKRRPR